MSGEVDENGTTPIGLTIASRAISGLTRVHRGAPVAPNARKFERGLYRNNKTGQNRCAFAPDRMLR